MVGIIYHLSREPGNSIEQTFIRSGLLVIYQSCWWFLCESNISSGSSPRKPPPGSSATGWVPEIFFLVGGRLYRIIMMLPKTVGLQKHPGKFTWNQKNIEREHHLPNLHFLGSMFSFQVWTSHSTGASHNSTLPLPVPSGCISRAAALDLTVERWQRLTPIIGHLKLANLPSNTTPCWE